MMSPSLHLNIRCPNAACIAVPHDLFLRTVARHQSAMNPPALKGFSGSRRSLMLQGCDSLESYLRHHSFVLNRIEGAGGVHHAATWLEKACRLQANTQLQGVESIAIDGGPTAPYISSLAYCTISAAGHVTQDAIVLHLAALQYASSPEMCVVTELRLCPLRQALPVKQVWNFRRGCLPTGITLYNAPHSHCSEVEVQKGSTERSAGSLGHQCALLQVSLNGTQASSVRC